MKGRRFSFFNFFSFFLFFGHVSPWQAPLLASMAFVLVRNNLPRQSKNLLRRSHELCWLTIFP